MMNKILAIVAALCLTCIVGKLFGFFVFAYGCTISPEHRSLLHMKMTFKKIIQIKKEENWNGNQKRK